MFKVNNQCYYLLLCKFGAKLINYNTQNNVAPVQYTCAGYYKNG